MLSLIVWTLIIITSIKYVAVIMRADNDGEGGILALMSLLGIKHGRHPAIIAIGMLGAALLFGDGAITPAISVLSALEGLKTPLPALAPYVVPLSIACSSGCSPCSRRARRASRAFRPGHGALVRRRSALLGLARRDPASGRALGARSARRAVPISRHGFAGFLVLGAVFLCATGAEALYADMGHFGRTPDPPRLVRPGVCRRSCSITPARPRCSSTARAADANPFFDLCPAALQLPLVALATVATVIASQSIITGAFSMTRQAIQLGLLPRITSRRRRRESYGQIYVGFVNWTLMALTLVLTIDVSFLGQSRRRLRHRGLADHAADQRPDVRRHARHLALEPAAQPHGRRGCSSSSTARSSPPISSNSSKAAGFRWWSRRSSSS